MKDIITGLKVVFCLAIIIIAFEYSPILGVISLIVFGILFIRSAGRRAYENDPKLMKFVRTVSPTWKLIIPNSSKKETDSTKTNNSQ